MNLGYTMQSCRDENQLKFSSLKDKMASFSKSLEKIHHFPIMAPLFQIMTIKSASMQAGRHFEILTFYPLTNSASWIPLMLYHLPLLEAK
jgi:hypothetical protein